MHDVLATVKKLLERIAMWGTVFFLLMLMGCIELQVWRGFAEAEREGYDAGGWEIFNVIIAMYFIIPVSGSLALLGNIPQIKWTPLQIFLISSQVFMFIYWLGSILSNEDTLWFSKLFN